MSSNAFNQLDIAREALHIAKNVEFNKGNNMPIPPDKTCSRCHQLKPLDNFYREKRNADGRCYYCKLCSSHLSHERYAPLKRPERKKAEGSGQEAGPVYFKQFHRWPASRRSSFD